MTIISTERISPGQWLSYLRDEFRLERFLPTLTAGVMIGVITIFVELSFAAMIFSGGLSGFLSNGIGFMLLGAFVFALVVALTSSFPGMSALPQDSPTAIVALAAASIAASVPSAASSNTLFFTVVAGITIASVITGIFFLLLGVFELGSLVRFIPYPVVGGFLAGTGWLLMKGGVGVMADISIDLSTLHELFQYEMMVRWIPGVVFGVSFYFILRRFSHFSIMPGTIVAAICVFYLALGVLNISLDEAGSRGWLLGPFPDGGMWRPLTPTALKYVDWAIVFREAGSLATLLVISVISLLLNAGGVELAARCDVDLNRELRSAGTANIIAGFCGCSPGYHALSLSVLGKKLGSNSRLIGIISALMCLTIFLFGASLLSAFPKFVLGGLLLMLGLSFVFEWCYDAWFTLPKIDYFLVLTILGVIGTFGFLQGVFVGFFIAVVLFVLKYSRIDVIKHVLSGSSFHSNVERAEPLQRFLQQKGELLVAFKLQGFLFFGTAHGLLNRMRQRIDDANLAPLRYLVFDFRLVTGLDSSAINSFAKMKQVAESQGVILIFVSLDGQIHRQFTVGGIISDDDSVVRVFPDLDRGMEWCEERILIEEKPKEDEERKDFLDSSFDDLIKVLERQEQFESMIAELSPFLERLEVEEGRRLIGQGEAPEALFFIESGKVSILIERENGETVRLRTMNLGTVVGELGYYLDRPSAVSAVVQEAGVVFRLSNEALQRMSDIGPQIAARFHKFMAQRLGEQLVSANNALKSILD